MKLLDPNILLDVTYIPRSNDPEEEIPPDLESAEMQWDEVICQAVIARFVNCEAQPLE